MGHNTAIIISMTKLVVGVRSKSKHTEIGGQGGAINCGEIDRHMSRLTNVKGRQMYIRPDGINFVFPVSRPTLKVLRGYW